MKLIKYTVCFWVFFVGILIIGESQIFRLENFSSPYRYTTLYLQYGQKEQDMKSDILMSAKNNGVEVFTFTQITNDNFTKIKIYGTPNVEQKINNLSNIHSRNYKSLFLGDIKFQFYPLQQLQGMENVHDFYIVGSSQHSEKFKTELIDKYAGNFPQAGYQDKDTQYTILGIWLLMIVVSLVLTYYDIIYQKKENLIRVSMGERPVSLILKNIVKDSLMYTSIFVFLFFLFRNVTSISLSIPISIFCFITMLVLNGLMYLSSPSNRIREAFSNTKSESRRLLAMNYILKLVTILITVFVISSNLVFIFESYNLYKQKPFFKEHSSYSYITTRYRPVINSDGEGDPKFTESEQLQGEFYTRNFSKSDAILLSKVHNPLGTSTSTIMANRNALPYLKAKIKNLEDLDRNHDIYFILPNHFKNNNEILNNLVDEFAFFENHDVKSNYEAVYYDNEVNLVAINQNSVYGSELLKDPIIIYNNISPEEQPLQFDPSRANYIYEIMYNINDNQFEQFIQEHHLTESNAIFTKTNVLNKFNESWSKAKHILYINGVFSALVLFLEFIIILSIIKLEYEVNAIELSIKKVLGYSLWQKNTKIILITLITTVISLIIAVAGVYSFELGSYGYVLLGGLIILISEIFVILLFINRVEKQKIQKILKGGNLS